MSLLRRHGSRSSESMGSTASSDPNSLQLRPRNTSEERIGGDADYLGKGSLRRKAEPRVFITDVVLEILEYFSLIELLVASSVCRQWRMLLLMPSTKLQPHHQLSGGIGSGSPTDTQQGIVHSSSHYSSPTGSNFASEAEEIDAERRRQQQLSSVPRFRRPSGQSFLGYFLSPCLHLPSIEVSFPCSLYDVRYRTYAGAGSVASSPTTGRVQWTRNPAMQGSCSPPPRPLDVVSVLASLDEGQDLVLLESLVDIETKEVLHSVGEGRGLCTIANYSTMNSRFEGDYVIGQAKPTGEWFVFDIQARRRVILPEGTTKIAASQNGEVLAIQHDMSITLYVKLTTTAKTVTKKVVIKGHEFGESVPSSQCFMCSEFAGVDNMWVTPDLVVLQFRHRSQFHLCSFRIEQNSEEMVAASIHLNREDSRYKKKKLVQVVALQHWTLSTNSDYVSGCIDPSTNQWYTLSFHSRKLLVWDCVTNKFNVLRVGSMLENLVKSGPSSQHHEADGGGSSLLPQVNLWDDVQGGGSHGNGGAVTGDMARMLDQGGPGSPLANVLLNGDQGDPILFQEQLTAAVESEVDTENDNEAHGAGGLPEMDWRTGEMLNDAVPLTEREIRGAVGDNRHRRTDSEAATAAAIAARRSTPVHCCGVVVVGPGATLGVTLKHGSHYWFVFLAVDGSCGRLLPLGGLSIVSFHDARSELIVTSVTMPTRRTHALIEAVESGIGSVYGFEAFACGEQMDGLEEHVPWSPSPSTVTTPSSVNPAAAGGGTATFARITQQHRLRAANNNTQQKSRRKRARSSVTPPKVKMDKPAQYKQWWLRSTGQAISQFLMLGAYVLVTLCLVWTSVTLVYSGWWRYLQEGKHLEPHARASYGQVGSS